MAGTSAANAVSARWTAMDANERLALIGAGAVLVSYLLGVLLSQWSLGLSHLLLLIGTFVAAGVVLAGASAVRGAARAATLRISAAVAAAYAFIDVGDAISELSDWGALDILFTVTTGIGAAILLVAAWRLTGGDIVRDASGLAMAAGRPLPYRLVLVGGSVILAAWVILRAANASFSDTSVLAVLATVLTVGVAWIAAGGAGQLALPAPGGILVAALAAVVAILALIWLSNILGDIGRADALDLVGLVLYVAGAAALVAGAALALQSQRTPPPS